MHQRAVLAILLAAAVFPAAPQKTGAGAHFERGRLLYEEHDDSGEALREAEGEFRRALALNPRFAAALAYLGFIAAEQDRVKDAEAAYRKALELDPRSPEARVGLARLNIRNGRQQDAVAQLREAVAFGPTNRLALRELAAVLSGENFQPTDATWREAIRCWETLAGLDPDQRDAHYDLARAYRRFGRWSDAEREYREVLRIGQTPDDLDVWVYSVHGDLAEMLEKQGKSAQAIEEYRALIASQGAGDEEIANARSRIQALESVLKKRP